MMPATFRAPGFEFVSSCSQPINKRRRHATRDEAMFIGGKEMYGFMGPTHLPRREGG
jgi:hypothetical protein